MFANRPRSRAVPVMLALCAIAAVLWAAFADAPRGEDGIIVFAAASTTDVMQEMAAEFERSGGERVRLSFASSGTLARLIDAGAPAAVFVSANTRWMDYLVGRGCIDADGPVTVAGNSLVLITPKADAERFGGIGPGFGGRLAVGEFESVPAGTYAKAALEHMGRLGALRDRMIMASSVRAVLLYVESGEAEAGIVYATDALRSGAVRVAYTFAPKTHPPIRYPAACVKGADVRAHAFFDFMAGPGGEAVWRRHGFRTPVER